ncbi:MAG: SDR family NAD(P)-dependent oxidoreductase [Bacteroidota bacterium]
MSTFSAPTQGVPEAATSVGNGPSRKDDSTNPREPIAIVGIGCRFPGEVNDPASFWNLLAEGKNAITDVPPDRWNLKKFYDPDNSKAGKIKNKKGGFVKNIAHFDPEFFNIFPAEAHRIDPQQRLLLEVTYQALEDAGIRLEDISGKKVGVYTGLFMSDYWDIQAASEQREEVSPHVAMGASRTGAANRVSYIFNLKGPSLTLDTACSSSLVGVHLACQSIWTGESKMALAGGVNVMLRPESSIIMSKGNFLSPDGYCKTYDSRANGYVRSEGCGVVVLKPLSQAIADKDSIYSVILGSAVNQDGHTEDGFTVPSLTSQVDMLKTAYEHAGVDPRDVAYIEAHGTGTPVGDPIETNAFGEVIGKDRAEEQKCWIGSVKTNIGHTEAAAGVAGLIKLALVLKNGKIPQNLHFETPNPKIPFDQYRLKVPTELTELSTDDKPLIGGVNSFGAGGTNAHVVLQSFNHREMRRIDNQGEVESSEVELFTLSAQSKEALRENVTRYVEFLDSTKNSLADICYTAGARRSALNYRLTVACRTKGELKEKLAAFLEDETRPGMYTQKAKKDHNPKLGFIFSGQGPQWYAMGQQLIQTSPVFRKVIEQIDQQFRQLADWSLLEEMSRDEATSRVSETRIAQPAIMAVQIGLTELWKSWGVNPEGCVGHSIGEVAAAYASGALTLAQAVEVIYHRSRGQNRATGKGKMLAAALTVDEAREAIIGFEDVVSIAAINGPNMLTFSGDAEPLEKIANQLEEKDVFCRFLRVNVPFHSHHMEPLKEELIESLNHLEPSEAKTPLYSTVTGKRENGFHLTSGYWYQNVREPVYFTDALAQMADDGFDTFIEIAPHPVLTIGANDLLKSKDVKQAFIVPSLRRKEDEALTIKGALGMLYTQGYSVNWQQLMGEHNLVDLPTYAWQHQPYWFEIEASIKDRTEPSLHPYLAREIISSVDKNHRIWEVTLSTKVFPYLQDHKVDGTIVFPGTGHLEIALSAGAHSFGANNICLEDIHFDKAFFLPEEGQKLESRLEIVNEEGGYTLYSREKGTNDWTKHSWGKVNRFDVFPQPEAVKIMPLLDAMENKVSIPDFYVGLKDAGLNYGDAFRRIQKIWIKGHEILSAVSLNQQTLYGLEQYTMHPALLDACLHTIFAARENTEEAPRGIYLPVHIQRYQVFAQPEGQVWTYVDVTEASDDYLKGNYQILDKEGNLVAIIEGLTCKYIQGSRGERQNGLYEGLFEYRWEEINPEDFTTTADSLVSEVSEDICYLVFSDQQGVANQIIERLQNEEIPFVQVIKGDTFEEIHSTLYQVDPLSEEHILTLFDALEVRGLTIARMLYLWGIDTRVAEDADGLHFEDQQNQLISSTMNVLRVMDQKNLKTGLMLVTQHADEVASDSHAINYTQAALYGMGRVLINENPYVPVQIIDISDRFGDAEQKLLFTEFMENRIPHTELALRDTQVFSRKLEKVDERLANDQTLRQATATGLAFEATIHQHDEEVEAIFSEKMQTELLDDEVLIDVQAFNIGYQENQPDANSLSNSCTGIVRQVGKSVSGFEKNDLVIAWGESGLTGRLVIKENRLVKKPTGINNGQAVHLASNYVTAWYALQELARVKEGGWVLIHTYQWDEALAAIRVAQCVGANVIATTASEVRKQFLQKLGITHVLEEKNTNFQPLVSELTNGLGVQAVFNTLPSDIGVVRSIKCIASFGSYLEVNLEGQSRSALEGQAKNIAQFSVNTEQLMQQRPDMVQRIMQEVVQRAEAEELVPPVAKSYRISALDEALEKSAHPDRTASVGVSLHKDKIMVQAPDSLKLFSQATYLITGGASGFGLEVARWLVSKGAKTLVLLSRSGYKSDYDRAVAAEMQAQGVDIYSFQLDITNLADMTQVVTYIQQHLPPLKGIIHSAAMLDDQPISKMSHELFMKVFRPKAVGAWNLHESTKEIPLDFFLMFSSISAVFGFPGQTNYSAANNFLDKLAAYRQSQGLAGSAVNLGVLGDYAGMSKDDGRLIQALINQGWDLLGLEEVTSMIENVLLHKPTARMAAYLDWGRFRDFYYNLKDDSRFAHLLKTESAATAHGERGLIEQLKSISEAERHQVLEEELAEALAKILGVARDKIETAIPITQIGLDSLMLNQLRNWIQQKLEINFPLMKIAKGPSINELSQQLVDDLGGEKKAADVSTDTSGIAQEEDIEVYNQWLVRKKGVSQANVQYRIFCIHPVGAGASMFSHFIYNPPQEAEVLAFQLPGRENRVDEPHYEDVSALVRDMATAMEPMLDKPFVIFGHSFGGMVGYELIRHLKKSRGKSPIRLFISGTIAPQLTKKWKERDVISETAILANSEERLLSLMSYIDDIEFLKKILPIMRKDMAMIMNYVYQPNGKLEVPITAFAANKDEVVYPTEVEQWREQTVNSFSMEVLEGDHWFLSRNKDLVSQRLSEAIQQAPTTI